MIERIRPASDQPLRTLAPNLGYLIPFFALSTAAFSGASALAASLIGGLVVIPPEGGWFVAGTAAYLILMDFAEWAFHVAQHKVPALWALHALHHSDEHLNASTTNRHFWAERAIKAVTVYVPVRGGR